LNEDQTISNKIKQTSNHIKQNKNMNTFVCISSYYKGYDFMDECKKLGIKVILITSENLKEKIGRGTQ
jgi:hypothetical protein